MWLPWKSKTEKFLEILLRSGLVNEAGISEIQRAYCKKWGGKSKLDRICTHLVASGDLTQWQADKLRNGKFRGFFLDNYKLVDHMGVGYLSSAYLAEDIENGARVILSVTPAIRGRLTYAAFDVEEC